MTLDNASIPEVIYFLLQLGYWLFLIE